MSSRRSWLVAVVKAITFACSLCAAPAGATTFCVPDFDPERCPNNGANAALLDLETAMSSEANDGKADRVVVAPGTYTDTGSLLPSGADTLVVEGAGAGGAGDPTATRLTTSANANIFVVDLTASLTRQITMRDLTVVAPASLPDNAGTAIQLRGDTMERVDIEIANPGSNAIKSTPGGGIFREGEIYPVGDGSIPYAIATGTPSAPGQLTVQEARIVEPIVGIMSEEGGLPVSVERTVIERPTERALVAFNGRIDVRNSIVVADGNVTALEARTNTAQEAGASGDQLTIVQESVGMGTGVSSWAEGTSEANLQLENSIVRGFASSYLKLGANAPANLTIRYSNFEPSGNNIAEGSLDIAQGNIDADPMFATSPPYGPPAGLGLLAASPSIDAGDPAPGGLAEDFIGTPRPLDGDGDGSAVRDQGAFEAPGIPGPQAAGGPGASLADRAVTVRLLGRRLRVNRRGLARLRVRCPAAEQSPPCSGVLVLTASGRSHGAVGTARRRRLVLARARFRVGAGKTKAVKLRIRRSRQSLLGRNGRVGRILAVARVQDAAGNRGSVRKLLRAVSARS